MKAVRCEQNMKTKAIMAALGILTLCEAASAEQIRAQDIYMVDGDTAKVDGLNYRLIGFDTPETYFAQCDYEKGLGDLATARARELIANAGIVDLVVHPGRDRYNRGLARLFVGGTDLGELLISEGLARAYDGGRRSGWC